MTFFRSKCCLFLVFLAGCQGNTPVPQELPPTLPGTPVTVTQVDISALREVEILNATATFMQKSVVKANTNGYLGVANIHLGQFVKAGQLLYTLQNKETRALGNLVEKVDSNFHLQALIDIRANQTGFITQLTTNANPRWDNTLHVNSGNMVLADGSTHQFSQQQLFGAMAASGDSRNCSLKP